MNLIEFVTRMTGIRPGDPIRLLRLPVPEDLSYACPPGTNFRDGWERWSEVALQFYTREETLILRRWDLLGETMHKGGRPVASITTMARGPHTIYVPPTLIVKLQLTVKLQEIKP